jgi:hypothetical protein
MWLAQLSRSKPGSLSGAMDFHQGCMSPVRAIDRIDQLVDTIQAALDDGAFRQLEARLSGLGIDDDDAGSLLESVHVAGRDRRLAALKTQLSLGDEDVTLERWLLLQAMRTRAPRVAALPVPDTVKELLLDEFAFMTQPDEHSLRHFRFHRPRFPAMAKQALLRRFPAGLFHWEESGVPRRWLLRIPWRDLPRALRTIGAEMGGFRPLLVPHLNARRRSPWLTETAANRSYYLMAEALDGQPHLRGVAGASWFRAPGIVEVAPHLAWVNKVFVENGGFVTTIGPADENSGVFANSPQRRALYEAGTFRPLIGLALWPRDAMLAWKHAHPEFAAGAAPTRRT